MRVYNFIMRHKKKTITNPEAELSFTRQSNNQVQHNNRLKIQILRVHAAQKQRAINDIWQMSQQTLCDYFKSYQLFPQSVFTMRTLLDSENLKLVKSHGIIYFGQVHKKKRSGFGVSVNRDGKVYEGQFDNNQKTGVGVEVYSNGNLYLGDFLNNKKHGQGQFFWFNLVAKNDHQQAIEFYDGQWWGGLPDGEGQHQKINGDLYIGSFKNGLKHGLGTENFRVRDSYKGEYVNGLPEGFGEYLWCDGSSYRGDFKQGLRSGYGEWRSTFNDNCERYQGHYCMDKKSGYGVYEWESGWIYKGNFENDLRNGYGELYDQYRCVYQGFWEDGEKTEKNRSKSRKPAQQSTQMSTVRVSKHSHFTDGKDSTINPSSLTQRFKILSNFSIRPEFTMTKGLQSHSLLKKSPGKTRYSSIDRSSRRNRAQGTLSQQIIKNHLYIPGMTSKRK